MNCVWRLTDDKIFLYRLCDFLTGIDKLCGPEAKKNPGSAKNKGKGGDEDNECVRGNVWPAYQVVGMCLL